MNIVLTNRERLLVAARELFLEQGYEASVDAIIPALGATTAIQITNCANSGEIQISGMYRWQ